MAVFGTAQPGRLPQARLGGRYNRSSELQWTSPVPHQDQISPATPRQRRTYCQQLGLITTRTQYRGDSFSPRTIRDWNSLSVYQVDAVETTDCSHFCVTCLPLCVCVRARTHEKATIQFIYISPAMANNSTTQEFADRQ